MGAKTVINILKEDNVTANTFHITESAVVPNGKTVKLRKFGGCIPAIGDGKEGIIALQWGNGGTWETVEVGCHEFSRNIDKTFVGNGSKKFRLYRENFSSTDKKIIAWIDAIVVN